jgi:hypothetical protein
MIVSIQKRRLSPDFGVGQQIQILEISTICLRFEFAAQRFVGRLLNSGEIHHFWMDTNLIASQIEI